MDRQRVPIGMIRHDEFLNALLAIWKTQHSVTTNRHDFSEFSEGYEAGFEEGLDAVAQVVGLTEQFETGKATHRAKLRPKPDFKVEFIDGQAVLLDD